MKLSKSLLGAVLIGITVQAVPACKKTTVASETAPKNSKFIKTNTQNPPDSCPGCGMG